MYLPSEVYFIWMIEESFHWRVFFTDVLPSNTFVIFKVICMIRYKNDYHPLKAHRSGVKKLSYLSPPIGIGLLYLLDSLSCFFLLEPPLYSLE